VHVVPKYLANFCVTGQIAVSYEERCNVTGQVEVSYVVNFIVTG